MVSITFKCGELVYKGQINGACGTVTLFADDHLGNAPAGIVLALIVDLVPVQKTDQVRILLNRTGLAKVRKLGAFVGS